LSPPGEGRKTKEEAGVLSSPAPPSSIFHPPSSRSPTTPRPQPDPDPGFVAVGRVLGPFGLKGELKVQPLTDNPARFRPRARLFAGQQKVTVLRSREAGGHLYLTFKGFPDRSSAERFRHALLQVLESDLPPLAEGEYYRFQLLGLAVVDRDGATLGTVDEIIETGSNDVFRVRTPAGADILLPNTPDVILTIDLAAKRMTAHPPEWS
jgi:16S rRNA processing protein RimM